MDGRWRFWLGAVVTAAALAAVVVAWPADEPQALPSAPRTPTTAGPGTHTDVGVPSSPPAADEDVDLFAAGAPDALAELLRAAGGPQQLFEIAVYDTYLIAAYRDVAQPDHIDRRTWRTGGVEPAEPNPIDDRVDAETEPGLFGVGEVDLARLPAMAADARGRYEQPVEVTHVLIDRFLPFDDRVLVRVYATPADGRSGGGYVTYLPDGTFVSRCC